MLNIWVGNLGKYNEGKLQGDWLELPKETEEIDIFLKEKVGLNEEYEEYMINDYETDLPYKVSEYDSIIELNLLAKVAEEIQDLDKIKAYAENESDLSKEQLMNLIKQENDIPYYNYEEHPSGCSNEEKYGYTMAEIWGLEKILQEHRIDYYFDYERYGRDRSIDSNIVLLDDGYLDMDERGVNLNLYTLEEFKAEYDIEEKKEKLKIVYKEVGKDPIVMEIEDTLEAKQELVGGLIEIVPYKDDLLLICNEEGKICDLKPNINLGFDYIAGNCFVIGDDYDNAGFKSIKDEQIEDIKSDLKNRTIEIVEVEEIEKTTSEDDMEF